MNLSKYIRESVAKVANGKYVKESDEEIKPSKHDQAIIDKVDELLCEYDAVILGYSDHGGSGEVRCTRNYDAYEHWEEVAHAIHYNGEGDVFDNIDLDDVAGVNDEDVGECPECGEPLMIWDGKECCTECSYGM